MEDPLVIDRVVKRFGKIAAVDGISFSVKSGEIFGLLGPNGAGKTTLISSIVSLHDIDEGKIVVCGKSVQEDPKYTKQHVGYVPQELIHYSFFSVEQVLKFHLGFRGLFKQESEIEEMLKRFELWEHRKKPVRALSGGMKRRMLIAKALLHKPKVLLLDEPSAGVDVELRSALWQMTKDLRDNGLAIVLTTHYLEEAEALCDRVAIIDHGKIKKMDHLDALLKTARKKIVLKLSKALECSHPFLEAIDRDEMTFSVPSENGIGELLGELSINIQDVIDIQVKSNSLESVFQNTVWGKN